jgi:hypothetical protein
MEIISRMAGMASKRSAIGRQNWTAWSRLSLPLKTNLTKDEWLQVTDSWQELKLSAPLVQDSLKVDPDFFVGVKMVD